MSTPKQEPDRATPANLEMRPIPVHTGAADEEGRLVVANGRLVAVLVRLADQVHTSLVGCWSWKPGLAPARAQRQCSTASRGPKLDRGSARPRIKGPRIARLRTVGA